MGGLLGLLLQSHVFHSNATLMSFFLFGRVYRCSLNAGGHDGIHATFHSVHVLQVVEPWSSNHGFSIFKASLSLCPLDLHLCSSLFLTLVDTSGMHSVAFKLVLSNPMGGAVLGRRQECRVVLVEGSRLGGEQVRWSPTEHGHTLHT